MRFMKLCLSCIWTQNVLDTWMNDLSFHLSNSMSWQTSECLFKPPVTNWYSDSTIQWFYIASWLRHHHGDSSLLMITPAVSQSPSYLTIPSKAELCCSFNYIHSFALLNPGLTYLYWSTKYSLKFIMKELQNSSNYHSSRLIEVFQEKPWLE